MAAIDTEQNATDNSFAKSAKFIKKGAIAGLIGGLGFGSIMAFVGMLPMVGMLIRQDNALTGFLVHMVISAFIGGGFGAIMAIHSTERPVWTHVLGVCYGLFWWFLGALFVMPILLGMPENIFVVGQMQIDSLIGHIVYGIMVSMAINLLPD